MGSEEAAQLEPVHKFNGLSGRRPQAEARRYVYAILVLMLEHELGPDAVEGWMFGGITLESDQRRLRKAIRAVIAEMKRKAFG